MPRFLLIVFSLITTLAATAQTVSFSASGGYCDEPFDLTLEWPDTLPKAYYTLDGTIPTAANGKPYTGPIRITTTTPVSAICVGPDGTEYPNAVRTFIFLADVMKQPSAPKGYPSEWTKGYKADYAMDQTVTLGSTYKDRMEGAMKSIPTVCLTTTVSNLFNATKGPADAPTGGIYIFPEEKGTDKEWERPASVEYYDADGSFQENCGLRIHGGNSRKPGNTPKHSFRIAMRKMYGNGKIKYPIFLDDDAKTKYDNLVLRAGYNYSWLKNGSTKLYPQNVVQRTNAQYIVDSWTKEAFHQMGNTITHRRFVHLYINGLYWGLYEASERIGDKFAAQYGGGEDTDWDVVEDHLGVLDGERTAFDTMVQHALAATTVNSDWNSLTADQLLDLENFIDYMLVQWYIGNEDWDENNWRAMRNRLAPATGFQFLVWDAEMGMTGLDVEKVSMTKGEPTRIMAALKKNPEFLKIVQSRVEKHFLGDGTLTPDNAAAIYQTLCDEIDQAIICESARWGDYRKSTGETTETYTRDNHWVKRRDYLLTTYFPQRTAVVLDQLQAAGLFDPNAVSGITTIQSPAAASTATYNLSGQRVSPTTRGIVIIGGRKVVRK